MSKEPGPYNDYTITFKDETEKSVSGTRVHFDDFLRIFDDNYPTSAMVFICPSDNVLFVNIEQQ